MAIFTTFLLTFNTFVDRLIALHHQHKQRNILPEIEAAWLHHRFTQIHPFQDGNGRLARCLASLIFIQAGWFPLAVTRDDRAVYIHASEQADRGDLSWLVKLFAKKALPTLLLYRL
ncbi:MAG TPA: Fic family protein [Oscillatoriaceae cyanobacterium M33_DOE_052]|uniref:Fido domain-containing protein n=1 Tax=Planktothricoides sp. SpSt-374 TaxID=2282167 RepID=A0A7C3ZH52_9CYAN|nr:Fic family protein [Oscillatoriaceae cyanobacterium M33_DOE_052]